MKDVKLAIFGGNDICTGDYKTDFWTKSAQYVVVAALKHADRPFLLDNDVRVELLSVNGGGEIRWRVDPAHVMNEDADAVRFFNLRDSKTKKFVEHRSRKLPND